MKRRKLRPLTASAIERQPAIRWHKHAITSGWTAIITRTTVATRPRGLEHVDRLLSELDRAVRLGDWALIDPFTVEACVEARLPDPLGADVAHLQLVLECLRQGIVITGREERELSGTEGIPQSTAVDRG